MQQYLPEGLMLHSAEQLPRYSQPELDRAQQEGTVLEVCDDLPKSFLVCDHPYHPQIVYLSELSSQTLQKRMEEST